MKTTVTLFANTINKKSLYFQISLGLIWVFTLVGITRSLLHIFLPDGGAQLIATIPLDSYSVEAQQVIVGMFAFWGLSQLLSSLVYVYILLKRKEWLLFAWLLLLIEYASRWMIGQFKPFETVSTAPGAIGNYVFIVLSLAMLIWYAVDYKKLVL
ncbi:MAG: hypothetical protein RLZZ388_589 [Bacillota bacterium]|jgi:hypothetical protein